MRIRSVSLLATTLAALLGCPLENMQASPSDDQASTERDEGAGLAFDNSEAHDDAVDAREDVSWVETSEMAQGSGALRVLMTDAPLEADNVFVTICGIYVQPRDGSGDAIRGDEARPDPREDGSVPRDREGTEPTDRGEADDRGEPYDRGEPNEMVPPEADPGADPAAPADDHPEDDAAMAAGEGEELTDEEREAAEHERFEAERERVEAERERIEAERQAAEAEGRSAPPPTDERDREAVPGRTDGADGQPPRDPEDTTGAPRGWYTVSDQCQTVDLLTLQNGVTEAMGLAELPAGAYGQIRLVLTEAAIVKDGLRQRLEVPSGDQTGIKVVGGFSLHDGEATTITLDFDAGASVMYVDGRFIMRPVIQLVNVTEHGRDGEARDDVPSGGQTQPRPESPDGAGGAPGREVPPPPPPPPGTDPRKPPPEGSEQHEPPPGAPDAPPPGSAGAGGSSGADGSGAAQDSGDSDG